MIGLGFCGILGLYLAFQAATVSFCHLLRWFDRTYDPASYPAADPPPALWLKCAARETLVKALFQGAFLVSLPFKRTVYRGGVGPAVVLVHGFMGTWINFWRLMRQLRRQGFTVLAMDLGFDAPTVETQAQRLAVIIAEQIEASSPIVLVGHSMGGLTARWFSRFIAPAGKVKGIISLGSPHHGSKIWPLSAAPAKYDLAPQSPVTQKLLSSNDGVQLPELSIFSTFDQVILPWTSSQLPPPARNRSFSGLGHVGLLANDEVAQTVIAFVRECFGGQGTIV